jgi:hypothetical protein
MQPCNSKSRESFFSSNPNPSNPNSAGFENSNPNPRANSNPNPSLGGVGRLGMYSSYFDFVLDIGTRLQGKL